MCGTPTYKLFRSLVEVGELNTKSFDDLARLLKENYDPKPSAIVQRFHFNSRRRIHLRLRWRFGFYTASTTRHFLRCFETVSSVVSIMKEYTTQTLGREGPDLQSRLFSSTNGRDSREGCKEAKGRPNRMQRS